MVPIGLFLKDCAELSDEVPSPDHTTRSIAPTIRHSIPMNFTPGNTVDVF
jgi:hypothetical protein